MAVDIVDNAKLRKIITAILEDANLDTVTARKVRQQVEAELKVDLTDRKKEVDDLVMEIIEEKEEQDANKSDGSDEEEDSKTKSKGKRRAAKKDDSEEGSKNEYEPEGKKKKTGKAKAAPKKGGGETGLAQTLRLSPELASVMGEEYMTRTEVVNKMWSIIKEKNLYDPKNKQFVICDEILLPVFGERRFRAFGMMKHLEKHFID